MLVCVLLLFHFPLTVKTYAAQVDWRCPFPFSNYFSLTSVENIVMLRKAVREKCVRCGEFAASTVNVDRANVLGV